MVNFDLSDSELRAQKAAQAFATQHLARARQLYARHDDYLQKFQCTKPLYVEGLKAGLIRAQIPREMGGAFEGLVEMALVVEEIYAVDPSVASTVVATGLGLAPLLKAYQPKFAPFLEPFLGGNDEAIASLAYSEPGGVANWLEPGAPGLQTTARLDGDSWILNGEKLWATNSGGWDMKGPDLTCVVCRCVNEDLEAKAKTPADLVMVLIVTRADLERSGPDAFAVLEHPRAAGFTAVSGPRVRYSGVRVPAGQLLCPPGTGAAVVEDAFTMTAALVGAMGAGIQRAIFDAALEFSKKETRGGTVPIGNRQSVADLLINIKMRTETSRYLSWKACHCLVSGPGSPDERRELALEAKIYCSDAAVQSAIDAINLVGVNAVNLALPFQNLLQEAVVLPIFDGGNVGIRRRQLQKIFMDPEYKPWAASVRAQL